MRESEYKQSRVGAIVRTNRALRNGNMEIPIDTEMEVINKRSGFDLAAPVCDHCGVRPFISRVSWREVDLVRHAEVKAK